MALRKRQPDDSYSPDSLLPDEDGHLRSTAYGSKVCTSVMLSSGSPLSPAARRTASGDGASYKQKLFLPSLLTYEWIHVASTRALAASIDLNASWLAATRVRLPPS